MSRIEHELLAMRAQVAAAEAALAVERARFEAERKKEKLRVALEQSKHREVCGSHFDMFGRGTCVAGRVCRGAEACGSLWLGRVASCSARLACGIVRQRF